MGNAEYEKHPWVEQVVLTIGWILITPALLSVIVIGAAMTWLPRRKIRCSKCGRKLTHRCPHS